MTKIRRATKEDSDFLFDLRNEEGVRSQSWNTNPFNSEDHRRWLDNSLINPRRALFVAEIDGTAMGVVRFDVNDAAPSEAEVSIALAKLFRGFGHGAEVLMLAMKVFFYEFGDVKSIRAHIKPGNEASARVFERAGFIKTSESEYDGHPCVGMIYHV